MAGSCCIGYNLRSFKSQPFDFYSDAISFSSLYKRKWNICSTEYFFTCNLKLDQVIVE